MKIYPFSIDVQFSNFLKNITNIKKHQACKIFDSFDVDGSGELDFDEFYLLIGILISIKVCQID